MTGRGERIGSALTLALAPAVIEVRDESAMHAGHAGAAPGGETHYAVLVVSEAFRNEPRVARSRRVHELLRNEFATGLHALSLTLRTPEEHASTVAS